MAKGVGKPGITLSFQGTSSGPERKSKCGKHGGAGESHTSPGRGVASFICICSSPCWAYWSQGCGAGAPALAGVFPLIQAPRAFVLWDLFPLI